MRLKLLIALALFVGAAVPAGAADAPLPSQPIGPAQEGPKRQPEYQCPTAQYLNCMPPITADRRPSCSKDYIAWVQAHCPKTQVVY
jgi:hypothetical protein